MLTMRSSQVVSDVSSAGKHAVISVKFTKDFSIGAIDDTVFLFPYAQEDGGPYGKYLASRVLIQLHVFYSMNEKGDCVRENDAIQKE